jgi:hypothetical protein
MAASGRSIVVGVFNERDDAERAIAALKHSNFAYDEIGFAARDFSEREGTIRSGEESGEAGSGAAAGALTGGVVGGVLGALAAGLIPGIGPVVMGGLLAGVLGGAAAGVAAGGIIGALSGIGVPEEDARYYDEEFRSGRTLVTVKAGGRYDEARRVLQEHGAYDVEYRGSTAGVTETMPRDSSMRDVARTSGTGMDVSHSETPSTRMSWDEAMPSYRQRWQQRYGSSGGSWQDYEPGYRYSQEMANDPRFRHRDWNEIESDMQTGYPEWSRRYGYDSDANAWERVRDHARESWEEARMRTLRR